MLIRLATLGLLVSAAPALAQQACAPMSDVFEKLKADFQEVPVFAGVLPQGRGVITVLMSPVSGTWTAVVIRGSEACLLASGDGAATTPPDTTKPTVKQGDS